MGSRLNEHWQVPEYSVEEYSEKKTRYCVCVFVINEGDRLHRQLEKMSGLSSQIDIVIADGGSTDHSTDAEVLKEFKVNSLLTKLGAGKLGSQMRMAFAWALRRGYKGVIVIDGNNKDSVEDIPVFISKLEQGYDHVQGSRFIKGGYHENTPLSRMIGLKCIHSPIMRVASGFRYTDTTNGFRGYSSRLLQDERVSIFRDVFTGYELHYYLAIKAAKLGFKCVEVPVKRVYPSGGSVPTKISPIRGNVEVIGKLLNSAFGFYDP